MQELPRRFKKCSLGLQLQRKKLLSAHALMRYIFINFRDSVDPRSPWTQTTANKTSHAVVTRSKQLNSVENVADMMPISVDTNLNCLTFQVFESKLDSDVAKTVFPIWDAVKAIVSKIKFYFPPVFFFFLPFISFIRSYLNKYVAL